MSVSRRDEELLALVGMTPEQAERDAREAEDEDETIPDPLTGCVHHGPHLGRRLASA